MSNFNLFSTRGYPTPSPSTSSFNSNTYLSDNKYSKVPNKSYSLKLNIGCLNSVRMSAIAKINRFLRRLFHHGQMDFEFASWQMLYLLIHPQKVYKNFMYRKKTKNQWARDDPAFLVLLGCFLAITSIFFAVTLQLSFGAFLAFFFWSVFIDCLLVGVLIATTLWVISNRYLRKVFDQDVEWGYCFDVHLNAFFPMLILIHVILPIFFNAFIDYPYFLSRFFGNLIWCVSFVYYVYITFLGYTALPILKNTHIFLYPITFIFIFYVAAVSAGWNISQTAMDYYHYRAMNIHRNQLT